MYCDSGCGQRKKELAVVGEAGANAVDVSAKTSPGVEFARYEGFRGA